MTGGRDERLPQAPEAPDAGFERVTRLAVRLLDVPFAYVSMLDEAHVHLKGAVGLPAEIAAAGPFPVGTSLCRHVVASCEIVAIEDAATDPRSADNPGLAEVGIRAYLGVPVVDMASGEACVLCAADSRPRQWDETHRDTMADLAELLRVELQLRAEIAENRLERERTLVMIREMEHRVKNSLSTVQAIIAMSLKGAAMPEPLRRGLLDRVASLAQTHTLLLAEGGTSTTFEALLDAELRHYSASETVRMEGPSVRIAASEAVTVGMVLHELATNAAKYGALAHPGDGRLAVLWSEQPKGLGERRLRFEWRETVPAPLALAPGPEGFGTTLLDTLIVRQQGGSLDRSWDPTGLVLAAELDLAVA